MKCIIPGINIKVFARAIHSLSKIGEELYIEPMEQGLALRTVNSSRSAYACFLFAPSFFQDYDDGSGEIVSQDSDDEGLRCKITMKSCLTVFRSLSVIEKTVERCKVTLNMDQSRLVYMLYCKHGIVKTHNLAFIECETLQAVFSKDLCPNILTAQARLLSEAVMNFQSNQEEITLIMNPEKVSLKNYVEDEPDPNKVMHTELCLQPEEFDNCQVGVDTEVTFCLKELRAILAFAEVTSFPVSLHFETAGRPIVLSIMSDASFEANFVLATLADGATQTSNSQQMSKGKVSSRKQVNKPTSQNHLATSTRINNNNSNVQKSASTARNSSTVMNNKDLQKAFDDEMDDDMDEEMLDESTLHLEDLPSHRVPSASVQKVDDRNVRPKAPRPSTSRESVQHQSITTPLQTSSQPFTSRGESVSPVIPNQHTKLKASRIDASLLDDVEDENDEETVPGTPPNKKFRSMFFGSQASTCAQLSQTKVPVLACDTDEED